MVQVEVKAKLVEPMDLSLRDRGETTSIMPRNEYA